MNSDELADQVFENHQRTSSRSGILKTDAVVRVLKVLSDQGIETKEELLRQKRQSSYFKTISRPSPDSPPARVTSIY
ncbi:MAG: hypothetical protein MZU97_06105 [Bacillus subtilis]|nr:hypothetical protein [Bacillus subtilis]